MIYALKQDANLPLDGGAAVTRSLMDTASDYEMEAAGPGLVIDAPCKLLVEQAFASAKETAQLTAGESAEAEDSAPKLPSAGSPQIISDGQTTDDAKKLVLETSLAVVRCNAQSQFTPVRSVQEVLAVRTCIGADVHGVTAEMLFS